MEVVHVLRADQALIVLVALLAPLLLQQTEHVLHTHGRRVHLRLVDLLGYVAREFDATMVLVRVPLGHVLGEEVHYVIDLAVGHTHRHEARLPQRLGPLFERFRTQIEARRTGSP